MFMKSVHSAPSVHGVHCMMLVLLLVLLLVLPKVRQALQIGRKLRLSISQTKEFSISNCFPWFSADFPWQSLRH